MRRLLLSILTLIGSAPAVALTEAMVFSPISSFYSQSRHAYFEHHQSYSNEKTFGIAYRLNDAGEPVELYRTENWSPCCQVLLSEDGRTLIRFFPWEHSMPPACQVFQFYRDGKLIRGYEERELLRFVGQADTAMVWHFIPPSPPFDLQPSFTQDGLFTLRGLNGWTYVFDATTGEIKAAHPPKSGLEQ